VLRAYEVAHAAEFSRGGRLRVEAVRVPALEPAESARARMLLGQSAAEVAASSGPGAEALEPGSRSVATLAEATGTGVAAAVDALAPGDVTRAIAGSGGVWIVRLVARDGGALAPLAEVRDAVMAGWRAEDGEKRVRQWLEQRRKATRVVEREVLR
jgi:hypothetical protein